MAIDSHIHVDSFVRNHIEDYIDYINRNTSLEAVINVGINIETSKEIIEIASKYPKFYGSVGIHPLYTREQDINLLYNLVKNNKIVAIGEIGLDRNKNNLEEQERYFLEQIDIANELGLPVIIHSNNTNRRVIELFEKYIKPKYGCVFHCFQPDFDTLGYLLQNDYFISFAGKITYQNAKKSIEVAKIIPSHLFLVETDSPYIAPDPLRKNINTVSNLKYIIKKLAEIKNLSYEEVEQMTTENTKRLFKKLR